MLGVLQELHCWLLSQRVRDAILCACCDVTAQSV